MGNLPLRIFTTHCLKPFASVWNQLLPVHLVSTGQNDPAVRGTNTLPRLEDSDLDTSISTGSVRIRWEASVKQRSCQIFPMRHLHHTTRTYRRHPPGPVGRGALLHIALRVVTKQS